MPPERPNGKIINTTGDTIVVACSDGISDFVTPEEILEIACEKRQLCGNEIVDLALSRQNRPDGFEARLGGRIRHIDVKAGDNASIAVMRG